MTLPSWPREEAALEALLVGADDGFARRSLAHLQGSFSPEGAALVLDWVKLRKSLHLEHERDLLRARDLLRTADLSGPASSKDYASLDLVSLRQALVLLEQHARAPSSGEWSLAEDPLDDLDLEDLRPRFLRAHARSAPARRTYAAQVLAAHLLLPPGASLPALPTAAFLADEVLVRSSDAPLTSDLAHFAVTDHLALVPLVLADALARAALPLGSGSFVDGALDTLALDAFGDAPPSWTELEDLAALVPTSRTLAGALEVHRAL